MNEDLRDALNNIKKVTRTLELLAKGRVVGDRKAYNDMHKQLMFSAKRLLDLDKILDKKVK